MRSIGIRELRQNASTYVRAAERGETIQVTDRGNPVALLTPLDTRDGLEALIAAGRATPPKGDPRPLEPPLAAVPGEKTLSEILAEMRADER